MQMVSNLGVKAVEKFLEDETLPVKIRYKDWWPNTCQKARKVVSSFWSRRMEGTAITSVASGALGGAYLLSDTHPALNAIWNVVQRTTFSCLNLLGINKGFTEGLEGFLTLSVTPSLAGLATTLSLGLCDVIGQSSNQDEALEKKPIFDSVLQTKLDKILETVRKLKEEKCPFPNLLLYGPPGTGKSSISREIAEGSGLNYIFISGGDLLKGVVKKDGSQQEGPGGAVALLQKLIEHAKSLPSPTVFVIDEAEAVFSSRDSTKSQELVSLLNTFLALTGSLSTKMMLILATNRPKDLDVAARNRMTYKIEVGLPKLVERGRIIEAKIPDVFPTQEMQNLFTPEIIAHTAEKTKGLSGRDLLTVLSRLKVELPQKRNLTPADINEILAQFVEEEQQVEMLNYSENSLQANPFYNKKRKELSSAG
jgi:AAA+ superfamily predicted ATPase